MIENDLTQLYCIIDDFFNSFIQTSSGKDALRQYNGKRGPKKQLSVVDIVTLNILRIFLRVDNLKSFHRLAKEKYHNDFPNIPNYENFLKATNQSSVFISEILKLLLQFNKQNTVDKIFYLDSTPVTVCENRYMGTSKNFSF